MSINRQEFTDAGRDMLGRANNSEELIIPKVVIGAGRANASEDLWPLTELLDYKMDAVITQKIDQGNGILLIDAAFNSSQAPEAFDLAEVGVLARIGAEPERIYSVANVLATGADHVDPDVESIHAFKIKVVIDRADNVTVIIGDSTDIMAENIGPATVGPGWFESKIATTLRFKRAVEGEGIELIEGPNTITIAKRVLRLDLDLYVPESHPQGTPDTVFPTIQAAWDSLKEIAIPVGRRATIHIAAGILPLTETTTLFHPDGKRIHITGAGVVQLPLISPFSSPGPVWGALNYQTNIFTSDAPLLALDDILSFHTAGSTPLSGAHRVISVANAENPTPSVIVHSACPRAGNPQGGAGFILTATSPAFRYLTQLRVQSPLNGPTFNILSPGVGSISNLGIHESRHPTPALRLNVTIRLSDGPASVLLHDMAILDGNDEQISVFGSGVEATLRDVYLGNAPSTGIGARGGASITGDETNLIHTEIDIQGSGVQNFRINRNANVSFSRALIFGSATGIWAETVGYAVLGPNVTIRYNSRGALADRGSIVSFNGANVVISPGNGNNVQSVPAVGAQIAADPCACLGPVVSAFLDPDEPERLPT